MLQIDNHVGFAANYAKRGAMRSDTRATNIDSKRLNDSFSRAARRDIGMQRPSLEPQDKRLAAPRGCSNNKRARLGLKRDANGAATNENKRSFAGLHALTDTQRRQITLKLTARQKRDRLCRPPSNRAGRNAFFTRDLTSLRREPDNERDRSSRCQRGERPNT